MWDVFAALAQEVEKEPTTEEMPEACAIYEDAKSCGTTFAKEGTTTRTLFADPPPGQERLPEEATIEYLGERYKGELCFRFQEGGRGAVPAFCWEVESEA